MNSFVFSSYSAYNTARASGVIATILNAAAPSATCISTVTEGSGKAKTYIDAVNVIVPRDKGAVGDLLVYSSANGFQWVKTGVAGNGETYHDATKLDSAGYTRIGYMGCRQNNEAMILALSDQSTGIAWGVNTETVSGVNTVTSITRRDRYSTWIASLSEYMAKRYADGQSGRYYVYTYPLHIEFWNAVKALYFGTSSTAPSGFHSTMTYSISGQDVTIGYTCTEGAVTIDPRDYNWDFHAWYRKKIMGLKNAPSGATSDHQGARNTLALIGKYGNSYAAGKAHTHAVSVTGFTAGYWWLPSIGELAKICENAEKLASVGAITLDTWYWSSTQYSASGAWYVDTLTGDAYYYDKSNTHRVRAVAAFQMN